MTIIAAAAALLAFFAAGTAFLGIYIARRFCFPKTWSMEETYAMSLDFGDYTEQYMASLDFTPFTLPSPFGYSLRGVYLKPQDCTPSGAVILCHGHRYTWHGMVKYMNVFLSMGYTVIAYNHRYHGGTGGENCSAGYFEKTDLGAVCAWARSTFQEASVLGVMGESMGGATVLQYMETDSSPAFVIADCPYSSMEEICRHQLASHYIPRLFHPLILQQARRYLLHRAGFSMHDVSPVSSARDASPPLLLLHGEEDTYVPPEMSRSIADGRTGKHQTQLILVPGARHAQSWKCDPKGYEGYIKDFVKTVTSSPHL